MTIMLISTINLIGQLYAFKQKDYHSYYLDNVVLARKLSTITTEDQHQAL